MLTSQIAPVKLTLNVAAADTLPVTERRVRGLGDLRFLQVVYEVRYPRAHKYWDDCGTTVEALEQRMPGAECQELGNTGFRFDGTPALGWSAASFYWNKTVVSAANLEATAFPSKFAETAPEFFRLVAFHLGIQKTSFVGNRFWYYVPDADEKWLASQELWRFRIEDPALGTPDNETVRLRSRIDDRIIIAEVGTGRVELGPRTVQGVIVNVDFQLQEPPTVSRLDAEKVIRANYRMLERYVGVLFAGGEH